MVVTVLAGAAVILGDGSRSGTGALLEVLRAL